MDFTFCELTAENFGIYSLDNFIRKQEVKRCWRKLDGGYVIKHASYVEDWDIDQRRALAQRIVDGLKCGNVAYGAFCGGELIGFVYLDCTPFGSRKQYIELSRIYVSATFRRQGAGRKLFELICERARLFGAEKLYVSANSAEESIAAFISYGCKFAEEINAALTEKEPYDLPLEFVLKL